MKKKFVTLFLLIICVIPIFACSTSTPDASFKITFIDVGQGDSALVECDGEYMLIDVGTNTKDSSEKIRGLLQEKGINELKYLVVSHWHEDHYGGLRQKPNALQNITAIDYLLCNKDPYDERKVSDILPIISASTDKIIVPSEDESLKLGSATIDVIDVSAEKDNDSLVLLITYGETSFLFTGDMEHNQENRICEQYGDDSAWNISLLKVAHHGSETSTSIRFLRMLMPKYAVISVAPNRTPQHPSEQTLSRLEQADVEAVYQTAICGNITVVSNGKSIEIKSEK